MFLHHPFVAATHQLREQKTFYKVFFKKKTLNRQPFLIISLSFSLSFFSSPSSIAAMPPPLCHALPLPSTTHDCYCHRPSIISLPTTLPIHFLYLSFWLVRTTTVVYQVEYFSLCMQKEIL